MTAVPIEVETNLLHMPEDRRHETVTRLFSLSINVESFGYQATLSQNTSCFICFMQLNVKWICKIASSIICTNIIQYL